MRQVTAVAASALPLLWLVVSGTRALDNGLAKTPPMGWISWERFACETNCTEFPADCISSRLYEEMATRLAADGFAQLGYKYVNIDDCWSQLERNATSGALAANASRFPQGISGLAQYVHAKQLKLGLYGDCGTSTCGGYPAQLKSEQQLEDNYFEVDAKLFAGEWQIDSFKLDGCNLEPSRAESICPRWSRALNATRRPVLLTCEWPFYMLRQIYQGNRTSAMPNFELAAESCNLWRYYEDIEDSWLSVLAVVDFTHKLQQTIVQFHGPGHWFDPDQLIVGNFALSLDQARAQMALWCIWSAPLFMSNDLRALAPDMAAVLKNEKLIGVDQDQLGVFGLLVAKSADNQLQAFAKPVEPVRNGCPSFAVVYLNRQTLGNTQEVSFELRDLLVDLPIELAARRYEQLYADAEEKPGGEFVAKKCLELLQEAMRPAQVTFDQLQVKPINSAPNETPLAERQLTFRVFDLFDDEPMSERRIHLNETLSLRVNPSGVRAVKLVQL